MRIAVLIKQIPDPEHWELRQGRLVRDGVPLEVNAYCRRANAQAVALAQESGEIVVFTMGPPQAEDALREMIACGASRGIHLCDPAFAGSDTLATARAVTAAITHFGPFDLVLAGLYSVDADTGQVGPEIAALLGWPFAPGVRELAIEDDGFRARLETDTGYRDVVGPLPAVLSCAERLISPSKADVAERAAVASDLVTRVSAADLGLDPGLIGMAGSPTTVGPARVEEPTRRRLIAGSVEEALRLLGEIGALDAEPALDRSATVAETGGDGPQVWCFSEGESTRAVAGLLGEAARLASQVAGSVTLVTPNANLDDIGSLGADRVLLIPDASEPEEWSEALAAAATAQTPWALLVEGTLAGRTVASTVAARYGWGLTGDGVALEAIGEKLAVWKPAFGGALLVMIESDSPVQMATLRPGVFPLRSPRRPSSPQLEVVPRPAPARVRTVHTEVTDRDSAALLGANRVVAIGSGVDPGDLGLVEKLGTLLGAELAATRKVTDVGTMARSRQIGLTGHSVSPHLYVALALSGKFNHTVGIRHAGCVLAINQDPTAPIFDHADVGLVADWREAVDQLLGFLV